MNSSRAQRFFWCGVVSLAGVLVGRADRFADPDLWWHLASGRWMVRAGHILSKDVFSYVPTLSTWVNHEWLWQVAAYRLLVWKGPEALIVAKSALSALVFGFCFWHGSSRSGAGIRSTAFLIFLTSICFFYGTAFRPHLASFVFVALWLAWLPQILERRVLWVLFPATACLWANIHGMVFVGLGLIFLYAVGAFRETRMRVYFRLFLVCCFAVTLNPFGLNLWIPFIKTVIRAPTSRYAYTSDWVSVFSQPASFWPYFALIFICVASLVLTQEKRRAPDMLILMTTAAWSACLSRLVPIFAMSAWFILPPHWTSTLRRFSKGPSRAVRWGQQALGGLAFLAVFYGFVTVLWNVDHEAFGWDWRMKVAAVSDRFHSGFPVDVVSHIREKGLAGNIATPFVWGGFLIWALGDLCRVSLDGRHDSIYPSQVCEQNLAFQYGRPGWDTLLRNYPTHLALVYRGSVTEKYLTRDPAWRRDFEGREAVLFVRR